MDCFSDGFEKEHQKGTLVYFDYLKRCFQNNTKVITKTSTRGRNDDI
jgi:hypothetical protein